MRLLDVKAVVIEDSDDAVVAAMASAIRFFILKVLLSPIERGRENKEERR
jgi:hypothetical protein